MTTSLTPDALPADAEPALARLATAGRTLLRRFNQRNERERLLLVGACAALLLMLADALWLGPALNSFKDARAALAAARQVQQGLEGDIDQHAQRGAALARQQQAELAQWRQRLREGDAALRSHEDALVGPDRMLDLLEQLLGRHGEVQVRAMRSLGRSDVLNAGAAATAATPATPAASGSAAAAAPATAGLYRHGVELVLEGGYADLLAYLKAMEALPQRVLWGSAQLKVEQHPRSVLTLRVYTLSRDPNWLEL